jgi:hypothetical protein
MEWSRRTKEIKQMIALAKPLSPAKGTYPSKNQRNVTDEQFLALLPAIRRHAQLAFRHLDSESREDAVAEVVAGALVAFNRLADLGRTELAYAGPLARFAVARVRDGRYVATRLNVNDVSSPWCRQRRGVSVENVDDQADGWRELVIDHRAGPAEIAVVRIDFATWLESLSVHDRRIAEILATGETTKCTAKRCGVSAGRISQLRRKLHMAWLRFQGEVLSVEHPAIKSS